MDTTSPSLLQRLRRSDSGEAWAHFVELYTPLLFYWARQAGLQEPDAADVVQDVLMTLLERLPGFDYDPGQSFRNWLCTITRNKCREHHRRQRLRRGSPLTEQADARQEDPGATLSDSDYCGYVVSRALALMRQEFQPATWQACWEHVVQGRPAQEVAAELHMSVNSVYLAKSRVLRRLRRELDGLLDCSSTALPAAGPASPARRAGTRARCRA
jgi:RNA polymerase sigma-70 factor (ECF subfamily)